MSATRNYRLIAARLRMNLTQPKVVEELIRIARESGDAVEPGLNSSMVSKWERGVKMPRLAYQRLLCRLFDTTAEQLGFRPNEAGKDFTTAPIVDRKTAILVGGSVALGVAFPWISDGSHIAGGAIDLDQFEHSIDVFRAWDDRFGGGQKRKAVLAELGDVTELLTSSHSAETTRRLFLIAAHLAKIAATMAWDSGLQNPARHYYRVALYNANAAENASLSANILAGMARQLLYLDLPTDALNLVHSAQRNSRGRISGTVDSMLSVREAWAHAHLGDVDAFRRATENASAFLSRTSSVEDEGWTPSFDRAELFGTTGGRLLDLARREQSKTYALEAMNTICESATLRRSQSGRSRALDQLGIAESVFLQAEPEEAARLGQTAIDTAERTQSDRVRDKLRKLHRTSNSYASLAPVKELRERIHAVLEA